MDISFEDKIQVESDIYNIEQILAINIFEGNYNTIIKQSVFTKLLIDLNDLVQKAKKIQKDSFEDIVSSEIIDKIARIRNATCHISSGEHKVKDANNIRLSFNIIYGKSPNTIIINDLAIGSDLEDDICILYRF